MLGSAGVETLPALRVPARRARGSASGYLPGHPRPPSLWFSGLWSPSPPPPLPSPPPRWVPNVVPSSGARF